MEHKKHEEREVTQFVMWSHYPLLFLILFNLLYTSDIYDNILAMLGIPSVLLSYLYHRSHEHEYQPMETISAQIVIFWMLFTAHLKKSCNLKLLYGFTFLIILFYKYSQLYSHDHYEKYHPWLHVLITLQAVIYGYS